MKAVSLATIKKELKSLQSNELAELCLQLAKFKKENKELLTYLLFESENESTYIKSIKMYVDEEMESINTDSYFYIKKSMRKILRNLKKYIRYSQNKETEVELLLYFCQKLNAFKPSINESTQLQNMYNRQLLLAKKTVDGLHEDLQYDFNLLIDDLVNG